MAYCPHCNVRYDEANETQPCCGQCGHPISCGCGGGHQYSPSPSPPPSIDPPDLKVGSNGGDESDDASGEESEDSGSFTLDEDLPF